MPEILETMPARNISPFGSAARTAGGGGGGSQRKPFSVQGQADTGSANGASTNDSLSLSPEAQAQLRELQQRDAEVRAHEQAHMAAAGQYASGPHYTYQQGPDGRQYAVGGHVDIDTSEIPGNPEATKQKAEQIRRAATAPGEPSAQDKQVAAEASKMAAEATLELREEKRAEAAGEGRPAAAAGPQDGHNVEDRAQMRAARAYADISMQGIMPTALAPGGTGISLQI